MLGFDAPTYAFRHELHPPGGAGGIAPGRLGALHWQVLERLRDMPMSPRPLARLAEHAEPRRRPPAIVEFASSRGRLPPRWGRTARRPTSTAR